MADITIFYNISSYIIIPNPFFSCSACNLILMYTFGSFVILHCSSALRAFSLILEAVSVVKLFHLFLTFENKCSNKDDFTRI